MSSGRGLRERKKERTRQLIAESAQRLFGERGFDAVSVAEIARAADVSEATVFNYFPSKEELFYSGMESFEERLVSAVRERPPGESALEAFRRVVLEGTARLAAEDVAGLIARMAQLIGDSRTLRAREREIVAEYTDALAALIAAETDARPDDVEPRTAAIALMGAQRALVAHVHASVRAGRRGEELAEETRSQGERAFARLERGLADYAVRAAAPEAPP